jgi:hypothetical protein
MASGVVSGAVALLLDQRPQLKPADAKAILQLTSSFMPSAGCWGPARGAWMSPRRSRLRETGCLDATLIAVRV